MTVSTFFFSRIVYALSDKGTDDFIIRRGLLSNSSFNPSPMGTTRKKHRRRKKDETYDENEPQGNHIYDLQDELAHRHCNEQENEDYDDTRPTDLDENESPEIDLAPGFGTGSSLDTMTSVDVGVKRFPRSFQVDNEEVIKLSTNRGSEVFLLGTNHASPESRQAVDSLIKQIAPQVVVVELCKTRIGMSPLKAFERNRNFNLYLLKDAVTELGISAGFIWYSMAYMERFISRLLNVDYGGDMRAAGTSTTFQVTNSDLLKGEKQDYRIMLGDRPIETTVKRMASILTPSETASIWFYNACAAILGLKCYLLNVPTVLFKSPKFNHVLLDERDIYITYSLQMAARLTEKPVRVIGIVGKAHVPGIVSRWEKISESDVRRIAQPDALIM